MSAMVVSGNISDMVLDNKMIIIDNNRMLYMLHIWHHC